MVSKHWMMSHLCSNTVLTAWIWKFHLTVLSLGSLSATTLSRTLVLMGDHKKNPENAARSEEKWLTNWMWDVTCCMMKVAAGDKEERWIFKKLKIKRAERAYKGEQFLWLVMVLNVWKKHFPIYLPIAMREMVWVFFFFFFFFFFFSKFKCFIEHQPYKVYTMCKNAQKYETVLTFLSPPPPK